jgi:KUP system potassium uptake protein
MQSPSVQRVMAAAEETGILKTGSQITYFVRSDDIMLTGNSKMAKWRKRFYAFLSRNAKDATSTWNVPLEQAVGIRISTKL